jgi:type I restriction enzyme M protein
LLTDPKLRSQVDQLWDKLWTGGLSNPADAIEQLSDLVFLKHLDEAVMDTAQAWAAKLRRTRPIGHFSRWKDYDAYQQAFERVLRDLRAES